MELGLAGKTAVVTGGSKGIGLETARGLAREGVRVMICARRRSALAEAAEDIHKTTGGKVETIRSTSPISAPSESCPRSSSRNSAASIFWSTIRAPGPTSRSSK